jgi:formylglycine-generating enzyme required for sulfatase activity
MKTFLTFLLPTLLLVSCGEKEDPAVAAVTYERKDGMVRLPGGSYLMGSEGYFSTPFGTKRFPEEAPLRQVSVKGFWIDETEVTNDQFAAFVKATGHVTFSEQVASPEDFPPEARANLPQGTFHQGAVVFAAPKSFTGDPNEEGAYLEWWRWDPEANWRQPTGTGSSIEGKGNHPVVCLSYEDAAAYAKWAGKRLPTEAEWEYAARGGLHGKMYTWGDEMQPGGKWMANTFQGEFPAGDSGADGFTGSSPVRSYAPNGFGLFDMAGNAWEICSDYYDPEYPSCCETTNPQGPKSSVNRQTGQPGGPEHRVIKGGSFLCHISYCMRYRPAARHSLEDGSPAGHTGFRCVRDLDP